MQEEYLHFLWRMKRLDFSDIHLANGSKNTIQVKDVGWYNLDAGPDFFNGTVIVDGIQWSGNIEIHVKSSDWYAHKHQLDRAYDNVILHVVYEHDKEVIVNGNPLPTIELKELIDETHLKNYNRLISNAHHVPCFKSVMEHEFALLQQIDLSFLHRIERKGLALYEGFEEQIEDKNTLFYTALMKAIGGRTNRLPMQQLSKILPYNIIEKERWDPRRIEALIFGSAGLLNDEIEDTYYQTLQSTWRFLKAKFKLLEMNPKSWKFSGIRPYSFPTYLLGQLSGLLVQLEVAQMNFKQAQQLLGIVNNFDVSFVHPYWGNHFRFGAVSKERKLHFSPLFKNNLLINGFIPFLIALKHLKNDFIFADVALELAENIPAERNKITRYWSEIGFKPKNALESQGLLELNNEFCTFRKCLSCKVGVAILENEKVSPKNNILL